MSVKTWTIRINLDRTGGPQNVSVATYDDGEVISEFVQECGPFDSIVDAVALAEAEIERNWGTQLTLWV